MYCTIHSLVKALSTAVKLIECGLSYAVHLYSVAVFKWLTIAKLFIHSHGLMSGPNVKKVVVGVAWE